MSERETQLIALLERYVTSQEKLVEIHAQEIKLEEQQFALFPKLMQMAMSILQPTSSPDVFSVNTEEPVLKRKREE